jgi:hypothetical protein
MVDVEYLDLGTGSFKLQYETTPDLDTDEVYTQSESIQMTNSGEWCQARFLLPDVDFQRVQYGGYGDFRIQDVPVDGELPHVFGRIILSSDRSPHPVALAPETLSYASRSTMALQWSPMDHAAFYRVDVAPVKGPGYGESFVSDGGRCGLDSEPAWDGRSRCALRDVSGLSVGLYQWRVEALDANGAVLGSPSDWSYLIQR